MVSFLPIASPIKSSLFQTFFSQKILGLTIFSSSLLQGGKTPLYIAARGSFTAIVDMIIKTARLDYPAPVRSPHPAPLHAGHHHNHHHHPLTNTPQDHVWLLPAPPPHSNMTQHSLLVYIYLVSYLDLQ